MTKAQPFAGSPSINGKGVWLRLHRASGAILVLFVLQHLAVHLFAWAGSEAHDAALEIVRSFYRPPLLEGALVLAILVQVAAGIRLASQRLAEEDKSAWSWIQISSGFYLALFLLMHSGSAIVTRATTGLDTNFYWAAGTLDRFPLALVFYPYYALGVIAVFAHVAAALHFRLVRSNMPTLILLMGPALAALVLLPIGGVLYEIELPPAYRAHYERYEGVLQGPSTRLAPDDPITGTEPGRGGGDP